jgi:hypothetical protein
VSTLVRPHALLSGVRGELSGPITLRRVPGSQGPLQGYVQPSTHNCTHDDGGLIGRELDTPELAESAAVSPSTTCDSLEELPMSVRAQGAMTHPTTSDTPVNPATRRNTAQVTA